MNTDKKEKSVFINEYTYNSDVDYSELFDCPNCEETTCIPLYSNYCSNCGIKLEWKYKGKI